MKRTYIYVLMTSVLLTSCFRDLGNYDYKDVEEFQVSGLEAAYNVYTTENLVIEPVVTPETGDYEYAWLLTEVRDGGYQLEEYADTLSCEKKLDVPFRRSAGEYELHLKVTSRTTWDAQYVRMTINAITPFTNACYLLYETTDGNSEMDIHYDSDIEPTIGAVREFTQRTLHGAPKYLAYLPGFAYLDEKVGKKVFNTLIIPASEQSMVSLNTTDMSVAREPEQWFYEEYDVSKIKCISHFGCAVAVFAETGIHTTQQMNPGTPMTGKFSAIPDVMSELSSCNVSSNICYFGNYLFFYDNVNRCLVCMNYNCQSKVRNIQLPPVQGGEPKALQIDGDVIFMGGLAPSGLTDYKFMEYMVIISETGTGQRKWYYVKLSMDEQSGDLDTVTLDGQGTFDEDGAFAHADFYSSSKGGARYIYAVNENRFYAMDPNERIEEELYFESLPEGTVTCFQTMFEKTIRGSAETDYNCFAIATCSEEGKYSVVFYDMLGGKPMAQLPIRKYEGMGKVKSIQLASQKRKPGVMGYHNDVLYSIHY